MFKKLKEFWLRNNYRFNEIYEVNRGLNNNIKSPKINLGQIQASMNQQKVKISSLSEVEFQVFSQFSDDGIIQYLVNKIPLKNKTFIEFGVEDYRESNSRFLLVNNYWSGIVMDGDKENIKKIKAEQLYAFYDLRALKCFITAENINSVIADTGFQEEVGILSIDIDGNDYWIWNAINCIRPGIIICEYNALFGFEEALTIPYDPSFIRGKNRPMNFYGTSLKAACYIAEKKGYFFIGCNSAGNNAYFIHQSLKPHCPIDEKTTEEGYNFAIFSESWDQYGEPLRGMNKIKSLEGFDAIDVETGELKKIDSDKIINSLKRANKFHGIH